MILHKPGPVWSHTSSARLTPLASASGLPAARVRACICCAGQSLLPAPWPCCQPQLVATICDLLTKAVPTAKQPPEKMTNPVPAWSHACHPIVWVEVPDDSCPARQLDVPLAYMDAWKACNPQILSCSPSGPVIFWKFNRQKGLRNFHELSRLATGRKVFNQRRRHVSVIPSETSRRGFIQR